MFNIIKILTKLTYRFNKIPNFKIGEGHWPTNTRNILNKLEET